MSGSPFTDPNGDTWIVSDVRDYGDKPTIDAIAFDAENVTATQRLDDYDRDMTCPCDGDIRDCETCHGNGWYVQHVKGWKHSKVLAPTVQEFMMKGFKKAMGIR